MVTVIVVIHLLVAISMIGLILMQKSEGNASGGGLGGSSASMSSMMAPRPRANPLTNATVTLGILFFATSIGLALLGKQAGPAPSIFAAPGEPTTGGPRVTDIQGEGAAPAPNAAPTTGPQPGSAPIAPSFGESAPAAAPPAVPQSSGAPAVPNN